MRLNMRTWGTGSRVAALVHGYTDDSATWWQIAPALAARGYTVLAPDLRGHGSSPRAQSYAVEDFACDLRDSLPRGADLVLGHSLGALALAAAVKELAPAAVVYVDPPWLCDPHELSLEAPPVDIAMLRSAEPRWSDQDLLVDVASTAATHLAVRAALVEQLARGSLPVPPRTVARSHVVVPDEGGLLTLRTQQLLEAMGYVLHPVRTGHVVHRDDPLALLEVLDVVRGLVAA